MNYIIMIKDLFFYFSCFDCFSMLAVDFRCYEDLIILHFTRKKVALKRVSDMLWKKEE